MKPWHRRVRGKKRGFFAVWCGRKLGVFHKWSDVLDSIREVENPKFKGFDSLSEATDCFESKLKTVV